MKNIKKITIYAAIFASIVISQNVNALNDVHITSNGYQITNQQYSNLKGLGFTDEEIDLMSLEELNENKDIPATLEAVDTKYSKIVYRYRSNQNVSTMGFAGNNIVNQNSNYANLNRENLYNIISDNYIDENELNSLQLVSREEYDITEEEYNQIGEESEYSINGEDIVETTGKKLVTTISYLSSSNRYRFKNNLTWKNMPSNRQNELFGIMYQQPNADTIVSSQKAYYNYTVYNGCTGVSTNYQKNYSNAQYWNTRTNSYYMSFPLKANESVNYDWPLPTLGFDSPCPCINPPALHQLVITRTNKVTAMSAYMYYDIGKSTSTKIRMLTIAGEYQHAYNYVSLSTSLSFGINSSSLSINITPSYTSKYDGMRNTRTQLSGLNW